MHSKLLDTSYRAVCIAVLNFRRLSISNVFAGRVTVLNKDVWRMEKDIRVERKKI